jgi:elongator complex protein 3
MENKISSKIANELIKVNPQTKAELDAFKRQICAEFKIPYPSNIDLLSLLNTDKICIGETYVSLKNLLRVRPVRSLSGIVNVSVLTKPYPCPGRCLYCPNEPGFPKSYLSGEPAAERARLLKFDPYVQVKKRLENLAAEGHSIDKIELRVIGGTWSYYPKSYQTKFITQCFKACNDQIVAKVAQRSDHCKMAREQRKNESAKCRIVGISIETRPDYIDEKEILRLRQLGVTRVELGVQSIYDDVLKLNCRGHNIDETIKATKLLKDAGLKVSYQIMLNLLGSSPGQDLEMAKELFSNPDFCPDLLKIYPCAVLKEAPLYKLYRQGKYKPYSDKKLIKIIKEIKKIVPAWVRIERIIRDIPSPRITAGTKTISNLRQMIAKDMESEDWACQCIRCREVKEKYDPKEKIILVRRDYEASKGKEIFLSFENPSTNSGQVKLFSLLRLRITGNNEAIIREIHTYGLQVPIGQKSAAAQHQGLGRKLIKEAERIAKNEFSIKKIAAISGVGARPYWRKFGYKLQDSYMVKVF